MKEIISLQYGKINTKKIFICFAMLLLGVGMIVSAFLFWSDDFEDVLGGVLAFPAGLFFVIIGAYFAIKYIYAKMQIKKWCKNSIALKAYAEGIANPVAWADNRPSKLRLTFLYEGNRIEKYTEVRDIVFTQFCDSEVDILYSPRYGQVLIVK